MSNKLYISNLSYQVDESILRDACGPFGAVTDVHIPVDRETGRARGFAFVTLESAAAAEAAIQALNGSMLEGRSIRVTIARPRADESPSGAPGAAPAAPGKRNFGPDRKAGAFAARYRNKR